MNSDFDKSETYDDLVKSLIIGDSAVGKTSILLRFAENRFNLSYTMTLGNFSFLNNLLRNRG